MANYRFVQLSDIHFGQEQDGEWVSYTDVRNMLLVDAEALARDRGKADLILISGDIAYSGKKDEYDVAGPWLDRLAASVQCRETDVRVVPGNHDCDRSKLNIVTKTVHRAIREGSPKSAYAYLDGMAKGSDEANPLLPKLQAYRDFAAGYESEFSSIARPSWEKNFPFPNGLVLRLVGMNSVQVSDDEDTAGNLVLGNAQYTIPGDDPSIIYAVMMHHPFEWFMDKAEAVPYLRNRARLFLVGHEHVAGIHKTKDELNNEWLDIYSGATTPPDPGSKYRYTYNWLEVSSREKDGVHNLVVTVFPRVWVPEKAEFAPDIQRLGGNKSAEFEIACPKAKVPGRTQRDSGAVAESRVQAGAESMAGGSRAIGSGEAMETENDAALARLKLLFWRHLDWQQRLKVLVQADALPPSADKPIPQTMERLALENARQKGRLPAIWDAMMEYVPPDKKEANPFRTTKN